MPTVDRFDADAAWRLVVQQLALGPRPAGSLAGRRLAARLRRSLPGGRFEPVPGGLRNVFAIVPGRQPERLVVVGAHYDTKDLPGFVGANDGASGTAVVTELARGVRPGQLNPTVVFVLFDGEESPRGTPDSSFLEQGVRGSRVAARRWAAAEAMLLLDFVGDRQPRRPHPQPARPAPRRQTQLQPRARPTARAPSRHPASRPTPQIRPPAAAQSAIMATTRQASEQLSRVMD